MKAHTILLFIAMSFLICPDHSTAQQNTQEPSADIEALIKVAEQASSVTSSGASNTTPTQSPSVVANIDKDGKDLRDCDVCPEMVVIPAGTFTMGSSAGYAFQAPAHKVEISHPFAIGKTEVTQGQWKAIMGNNPSRFSSCGDSCPVEGVSWHEAQIFVERLSEKTGKDYRLPSEAEWEYACKAGKNYEYCGSDSADAVAWCKDNSDGSIHPVAMKKPNAFGLFDMTGNVKEWVSDSYHQGYEGAPTDGSAWRGGLTQRVTRGGSWENDPWSAIDRGGLPAGFKKDYSGNGNGFRVTRTLN